MQHADVYQGDVVKLFSPDATDLAALACNNARRCAHRCVLTAGSPREAGVASLCVNNGLLRRNSHPARSGLRLNVE